MKTSKESKILIVHNRPQFILALEATLNKPNRIFLNATSGLETLAMTKIDDVDLIIMDCNIDDMDIISLTGLLRIQEKTKNIPFIILNETPTLFESYFHSWPSDSVEFLVYPINSNRIEKAVQQFENNDFKWAVKIK
jgi:hypothetical protein